MVATACHGNETCWYRYSGVEVGTDSFHTYTIQRILIEPKRLRFYLGLSVSSIRHNDQL